VNVPARSMLLTRGGRVTHSRPTQIAALAHSTVEGAAGFVASLLPGGPNVPLRVVEDLLSAHPDGLDSLALGPRRIVSAAMMVAHARHGRQLEAVSLARRESDRATPGQNAGLPASTLAHFWSAAAEAYATAGLVRDGARAAQHALEYAQDTGDDALRYRALGLMAANLAISGEFARAEPIEAEAVLLERCHNWGSSRGSYMLRASQILLASARMDVKALSSVAESLRLVTPSGPTFRGLIALAEAAQAMINGHAGDGVAALTLVANSVDAVSMPPLMYHFLLSYQATLLISRGEPQRALGLLDGRHSDPHHAVCFGLQRASAYLQLGDNRAVLNATSGCLRVMSEHNLRTLAPVLLRRAIAYERLDLTALADAAFADAFQLIRRSGAGAPLLTLPSGELQTLLGRLRKERPELAREVDSLRVRMMTMPATVPPTVATPLLTTRESVVAGYLRGDHTLTEIGRALHVSRNTVKSQVSSLYRKLGVTNRAEALAELDRFGFFDYRGI